MNKTERDKICTTCTHKKIDERYGIICGLTDNIANFIDNCRYYSKNTAISKPIVNSGASTERKTVNSPTTIMQPKRAAATAKRKSKTKKKKNPIGAFLRNGFLIYIAFRVIRAILKAISE